MKREKINFISLLRWIDCDIHCIIVCVFFFWFTVIFIVLSGPDIWRKLFLFVLETCSLFFLRCMGIRISCIFSKVFQSLFTQKYWAYEVQIISQKSSFEVSEPVWLLFDSDWNSWDKVDGRISDLRFYLLKYLIGRNLSFLWIFAYFQKFKNWS